MKNGNIIWKRPDGFHGASPEDFRVTELPNGTRMWLHRDDHENYPFRISGGWQDEVSTQRLNQFMNNLDAENQQWDNMIQHDFQNHGEGSFEEYLDKTTSWVETLRLQLKGDTWEREIMESALIGVHDRVKSQKPLT